MQRLIRPAAATGPLIVLACIVGAGCETGGKSSPPKGSTDKSVADGAAIGGSSTSLDTTIRSSLPRRRAALALNSEPDQWPAEWDSRRASSMLANLGSTIAHPGAIDPSSLLLAFVDPDVTCTSLRPETLSETRRDDTLVIRRATVSVESEVGRAKFADALRALRKPFGDQLADVQLDVERVDVGDVDEDSSFTTRVRYTASGVSAENGVSQSALWDCRWKNDPGLTLTDLRLVEFEETTRRSRQPTLFENRTAAILGGERCLREQLLYSCEGWSRRIPANLGGNALGYQGLAIGDVNGDGRDDLYVCQGGGLPNRLFLQNADGTTIDKSQESGVDILDRTHAALLVDLDNDGDQDLVLGTQSVLLVLANDGRGKFKQAHSEPLPDTFGLSAADYDQDGDLDLFACRYADPPAVGSLDPLPIPVQDAANGAANALLRNEGRLRFVSATAEAGLDRDNRRWSVAAAWEDFDQDGDLDLYVVNDFAANQLFQNDQGRFADVASRVGVADRGQGRSVTWGDFNRDGLPDLFVSNASSRAARMIAGAPQFHPQAGKVARQQAQQLAEGDALLINSGDGTFRNLSADAGIRGDGWSYGSIASDLNNDGWLDLAVARGHISGELAENLDSVYWRRVIAAAPTNAISQYAAPMYAAGAKLVAELLIDGGSLGGQENDQFLLNTGGGPFANANGFSGAKLHHDNRTLALVDWDRDGDLDLWTTSRNGPQLRFLRNVAGDGGRSLSLRLVGSSVNRDAIGARVEVQLQGESMNRLVQTLRAGDGFLSQSSKWLHFGLGPDAQIKQVLVHWPGARTETFAEPSEPGAFELVQGSGRAKQADEAGRNVECPPTPQLEKPRPLTNRVWFPARPPAPPVRYDNFQGRDATVLELGGAPALVTIWGGWSQPSQDELKKIGGLIDELQGSGVQVLALSADGIRDRAGLPPADQMKLAKKIAFPFPIGALYADGVDQLEILYRQLFGCNVELSVPTSFLMDEHGELAALYLGPVNTKQLLGDVNNLTASARQRRRWGEILAGTWVADLESIDAAHLADGYLAAGYAEDAIPLYVAALRQAPRSPTLKFRLGKALAAAGKDDEALARMREAIRLEPDFAAAHFAEGQLLLQRNQPGEALEPLRKAVAIAPDLDEAYLLLGQAMAKMDAHAGASTYFREAVKRRPRSVAARIGLGASLAQEGQLDDAADELQVALDIDPLDSEAHHGEAHHQLAIVEIRRGEINSSIAHYRLAHRSLPDNAEVLNGLGAALARQGNTEQAVASYRAALKLVAAQPESPQQLLADLNYNLAVALQLRRDVGGAIRHYRRALDNRPNWPVAANGLAWVLATSENAAFRDPDLAVQLAEEASRATNHRVPELLDTLAAALASAGRYGRAASTARRAIELAKDAGRDDMALQFEPRLELYEAEKPYIDAATDAPQE